MIRAAASAVLLCALAAPARAQSATAEVDATAGASTEDVRAVAVQGRLFGDLWNGWRFFLEASWAKRATDEVSDAFGAAYPYTDRLKPIENYLERVFRPGAALVAVKAGRYRTPFGLSARGDHAYNGFLRAPLIRYDGYFALSNNYLEHGASITAGVPAANVLVSLGRPGDAGLAVRRPGLDTVIRGQVFHGPMIAGVSYSRTLPYQPAQFAPGRAVFGGVDVRVMRRGVLARGEWIAGRPFDGTRTRGGYVDLIVHERPLGPLTLVARAEYLDYDAIAPFAAAGSRYTVGGRLRLPAGFTAHVNAVHNAGTLVGGHNATSLDAALTYSARWR